ncbi:leucine-rich_repeat domain-containing protein [Hexamita inflata]|uniref:Leucine-rich_repeat domain-containing protein n=1 Tax=Hexamita inflata TaxID=28002 RepID=A0ABP1I2A4_9EUKA
MTLSQDQLKELYPNYHNETELQISSCKYTNINILNCCENVQKLTVQYNKLDNILKGSSLLNLKELYIYCNPVQEIDIDADLVVLHMLGTSINNLQFLQKYKNLGDIDISNNQLQDSVVYTKLNLPRLLKFSATNCNLNNLSFLVDLKEDIDTNQHDIKLQQLDLSENFNISLQNIQQLNNLTRLILNNCGISDITHIVRVKSLIYLDLSSNNISELTLIEYMINLECLNLNYNRITQLNPLGKLRNIQQLYIGSIGVQQLSGIQNLTNLQYLEAWGNKLETIQELELLKQLKEVNISYNNVCSLCGLRNATLLEKLDITKNNVQSFDGLQNCYKLRELSASQNYLKSINEIGFKPNLELLLLGNNCLESFEGLQAPKLQKVNLSHTNIKTLIINLHYLKELTVDNCNLINCDLIGHFGQLQSLNLSNNNINSIQSLSKLNQLKTLNVSHNQLNSLEGIENMQFLQHFDASNNNISNLYHLISHQMLISINLDQNQLHDYRQLLFLKQCKNLEQLILSENSDINNNTICQHPHLQEIIITLFPSIKAFKYEVELDHGRQQYNIEITPEQILNAKQMQIQLPELTEQLILQLQNQ